MVVGLGPAGPDLLTAAAMAAIEAIPTRFVRTARHPAATAVAGATPFDAVYEAESNLDAVYSRIVGELVAAAEANGEVLYAVPGSPMVAERTVELLCADPRVECEVTVAVSFADLAWNRLGVDPVAAGARLVDGRRFAVEAAGERGPLLVAQCDSKAVMGDIKLAADGDPGEVTVLQRLGLHDEAVFTVAWPDLDRVVEPDHLTSLYLPALAPPVAAEVARFAELVRELRDRCPWDREQTHRSLTRHLLEEAYELLEAIENLPDEGPAGGGEVAGRDLGGEEWDHLQEELGDVLFQVAFHSTLAEEEGRFTLADVARGVHDKLVARHPHVFGPHASGAQGAGEPTATSAADVAANWERNKMQEKGRASLMDGIPLHLPALLFALKVARRAANAGMPVDIEAGARTPPAHGPGELGPDELGPDELGPDDLGPALFGLVEQARRAGLDPEAALRATTSAVRDRFVRAEALAAEQGLDIHDLDPPALSRLWQDAG